MSAPSSSEEGSANSDKSKDEKLSYFAALGELIHYFSKAEDAIHILFWHITGIDANVARVIGTGLRLADVMKMTRRIARARSLPQELQKEIETLFNHFETISTLRDTLVHKGVENTESIYSLLSSNIIRHRFIEEYQELRFNLGDILYATSDLLDILMRIGIVIHPELLRECPDLLTAPWRYKPRQPVNPFGPLPKAAQSRKRLPPSSRK